MSRFSFTSVRLAGTLLGCGVSSTLLIAAPQVAKADETSTIAGVKLPRGAATYNSISDRYTALLTALSQEKAVGGLKPADTPPEVFIWQGGDYREDRVAFTKGAFATTLGTAGYTIKEISSNDLGGLNIFNYFPLEEENNPFRPNLTKQSSYILAQNNAKKRAFVATWLESDNSLTLGILPVEFKAPRGSAKWPAPGPNAVLIKNWKNVSASLPTPKMPTFAVLAPKAGMARGWLKDAGGKPIAGAEVVVESSYGGGLRTHHKARSNAQGLYQVMVPVGIARVVSAETKRTYNGEQFTFPLVPARGETKQFNSSKGGVENFVLHTFGEEGAVIRLSHDLPDKSDVEVTLVPQGPLFDGTAGKTLIYRFTSSQYEENYLAGLPLGRYLFSARVYDEGDILPIRVYRLSGSEKEREKNTSLLINFESGYTYSTMVQSNRDIAHYQVIMVP